MITEVDRARRSRAYAGATWTAPAPGTYQFNRFTEAITAASEPAGDVNRDGDTTDRFGRPLRPGRPTTSGSTSNQDRDFTDDG